jgi:hypothetical protein
LTELERIGASLIEAGNRQRQAYDAAWDRRIREWNLGIFRYDVGQFSPRQEILFPEDWES